MERLRSEYGVDAVYEPVDYHVARWIECDDPKKMADFEKKNSSNMVRDAEGSRAYLTTSEFQLDYCMKEWPTIAFHKTREINRLPDPPSTNLLRSRFKTFTGYIFILLRY